MMRQAVTQSNPLTLTNPNGLYDPAPNGYSHVACVAAGTRLVFIAGQGGKAEDGKLAAHAVRGRSGRRAARVTRGTSPGSIC